MSVTLLPFWVCILFSVNPNKLNFNYFASPRKLNKKEAKIFGLFPMVQIQLSGFQSVTKTRNPQP